MKNYVLAAVLGFIVGVTSYYYLGIPKTITEIKEIEVEKIVEKVVVVDKEIIKRVPVVQKVERIVYRPAKSPKDIAVGKKELECMALNIYREANNQSLAGMIAVARVVMNRVKDRRYPDNPCDVIYEGPVQESWKTRQNPNLKKSERIYYPRRNRCQFSWYCDGKKDEVVNKKDNIKWRIARDVAYSVLAYDRWAGIVEGATHYHATYVKPAWRKKLKLVAKIDDHIFYRWQ